MNARVNPVVSVIVVVMHLVARLIIVFGVLSMLYALRRVYGALVDIPVFVFVVGVFLFFSELAYDRKVVEEIDEIAYHSFFVFVPSMRGVCDLTGLFVVPPGGSAGT